MVWSLKDDAVPDVRVRAEPVSEAFAHATADSCPRHRRLFGPGPRAGPAARARPRDDRPGHRPPAGSARGAGRRAPRRQGRDPRGGPHRPRVPPAPLGPRRRPLRRGGRPGQQRRGRPLRGVRRPGSRGHAPDHRTERDGPAGSEPEGRDLHDVARVGADRPDVLGARVRGDPLLGRLHGQQARGQRPGQVPPLRAPRDERAGLGRLSRAYRERVLGRGDGAGPRVGPPPQGRTDRPRRPRHRPPHRPAEGVPDPHLDGVGRIEAGVVVPPDLRPVDRTVGGSARRLGRP
jgi:hypothetical protein